MEMTDNFELDILIYWYSLDEERKKKGKKTTFIRNIIMKESQAESTRNNFLNFLNFLIRGGSSDGGN